MKTVIWMLGIGAGVAGLVLTAALKLQNTNMAYAHMAVAAIVALGITVASRRELREEATASPGGFALATGLRYLGLIWTWGALTLFATYSFILQWREWWHFVLVFVILAGLCLFLSASLRAPGEKEAGDETIAKIARIITMIHLGAGVITAIGLIIDGKLWRFLVARHQDWAAQNIFFFGALAIAAIAWFTLAATRPQKQ